MSESSIRLDPGSHRCAVAMGRAAAVACCVMVLLARSPPIHAAAMTAPAAPVPVSVSINLQLAALHPAVSRGALQCGVVAQSRSWVEAHRASLTDFASVAQWVLGTAHYFGQQSLLEFPVANRAFNGQLTYSTTLSAQALTDPATHAPFAPDPSALVACWLMLNGQPAVWDKGPGLQVVGSGNFASVDSNPLVIAEAAASGAISTSGRLSAKGAFFVPGPVQLAATLPGGSSASVQPGTARRPPSTSLPATAGPTSIPARVVSQASYGVPPCADVCITAVTMSSIRFQWAPISGVTGAATHYRITRQAVPAGCSPYSASCGLAVVDVADVPASSTLTAAAVHLLPSTQYSLTIKALGPGSQVINPIGPGQGGVTPGTQVMPEQVVGVPRTAMASTSGVAAPQNVRVTAVPHCDALLHVTWDAIPDAYGFRVTDGWEGAPQPVGYQHCDASTGGCILDFGTSTFGGPVPANEVYMHSASGIGVYAPSTIVVKTVAWHYTDAGGPPPGTCTIPGFYGQGTITVWGELCTELWSAPSSPVTASQFPSCAIGASCQPDNSACAGWAPADPARPDGPYVYAP